MFEHSVKVPRHYKIAANIFKKVSTEGGSVKTLLYDDKLRHFRTNVLYALITETIKHAADIDKIFENCGLLKKENRLDPWLAKVLTTELLFGKKLLPGKSKPEQTILSYKEQFEKYTSENGDDLKTEVVRRPRYVRVNTNLLTTSDAIRAFQDEGYRFVRCTSGSYDDYLKQIQQLTEYDFVQDYHVKTIFVFPAGTKLHEHELYLENKIILQDKATAMAVHLLAAPPGSAVLDMCAAPGMKTTQLAAYMRNQGRIYAVERNEKRYKTLCDFVEKTDSKCVETLHRDSLDIKRGELDDVEYILLDPSCSGSGMELCVHNYIEQERLAKLTSLQEKFLKHAMNSFPKAKRIVYSTCSLFPEENERVITNVVKTSRAKWRVQDVKELLKGQWNNVGSGMYGSMGARCMYAKPDSDFTIGFFLAVLDRDQKDLEKASNNENAPRSQENEAEDDLEEDVANKKKKKKKKRNEDSQDIIQKEDTEENPDAIQENTEESENTIKKKKKKKDKRKDLEENTGSVVVDQTSSVNNGIMEESPSKKRKKEKQSVKQSIQEDTEIQEESNDEPVVKKKNTGSVVVDQSSSVNNKIMEQNPSKKRKKEKKSEKQSIQKDTEIHEESNDEPVIKKKKSKARDDVQDYTDVETVNGHKKKKNKHYKSAEIEC